MSTASSNCRIDWRASRQLCLALLALGVLAALAVLLAELPLVVRLLLAAAALAHAALLARREWRRPPCTLEFDEGGARLMQAGGMASTLHSPRLRLRGVLASLDWRDGDGRRHALLWCADTLPVPARRQLRLRLGGQSPA